MPVSELVALRMAYVVASDTLSGCRKARMAPHPRVYQKAYEAYRQALSAYDVEAERVASANYPRPYLTPLPGFVQISTEDGEANTREPS
jgi:hypothetical protein